MELFKIKSIDSKLNIVSSLDGIPSFETPLGELKAEIFIDNKNIFDLGILKENISISDKAKLLAFQNDNYLIEILSFGRKELLFNPDVPYLRLNLPNHHWIIRIKKLSGLNELLKIKFKLYKYKNDVNLNFDHSQYFEEVIVFDNNNYLVLGVEDYESFNYRAKDGDWFPKRFYRNEEINEPLNELQFYELKNYETLLNIPYLYKKEQIQFNFSSCFTKYDITKNEYEFDPENIHEFTDRYLCSTSTNCSYEFLFLLLEDYGIFIE